MATTTCPFSVTLCVAAAAEGVAAAFGALWDTLHALEMVAGGNNNDYYDDCGGQHWHWWMQCM